MEKLSFVEEINALCRNPKSIRQEDDEIMASVFQIVGEKGCTRIYDTHAGREIVFAEIPGMGICIVIYKDSTSDGYRFLQTPGGTILSLLGEEGATAPTPLPKEEASAVEALIERRFAIIH